MAIENYDYHEEFRAEGEPFYDSLRWLDKVEFNKWVVDNFIEVDTIKSFEKVRPSKEVFDKIVSGYKHIHGQCHYSAKAVCLLDSDIEYYTGFIERQDSYYPIVTHSFNVNKGLIIDFSRLKNDFTVIEEKTSSLPHTYYGIKIPTEFVNKYRNDVFEENSETKMRPLLYEWFQMNKDG